ncbi:MAG: hypothetical protein EHM31_12370 [Candidatus Aminicenantes bacterium]|nr:MAG: hypothetical protein EHM31_12370 [Candidatus Aminicenantes bacterium]
MTDDWAAAKARRAARRTLAATAASLGVVLFVFASQSRWVRNVFKGPFEISAAELSTIKGIWNSPIYFVRVTGTDPVDMGVVLWTVETKNDVEVRRSVTSEYYSLVVGDKRLIVETAELGSVRESVVIGALTAFPPGLRSRLEGEPGRAALRRDYYPFYLKAGSIRGQVFWFIGAAVLIVGAFFLLVRPRMKILASPDENPLMNKIKIWGSPAQISSDLEREWRMPADLKLRSWRITASFLIRSGPFDFDVFRFEDILWAYGMVTHHGPILSRSGARTRRTSSFRTARPPFAAAGRPSRSCSPWRPSARPGPSSGSRRRPGPGSARTPGPSGNGSKKPKKNIGGAKDRDRRECAIIPP